jgi:hypothetical protein
MGSKTSDKYHSFNHFFHGLDESWVEENEFVIMQVHKFPGVKQKVINFSIHLVPIGVMGHIQNKNCSEVSR